MINIIRKPLLNLLDDITMYRLMVYGLLVLSAIGMMFSALGILSLPIGGLALSFVIIMATGFSVNKLCSVIFGVPLNIESGLITSLILFCILPPVSSTSGLVAAAAATAAAMLSKFIVAYNGKHIFNPAAFGAVYVALLGIGYASWWIGTPVMAVFVAMFGLLIISKLRLGWLAGGFIVSAIITASLIAITQNVPLQADLKSLLLSSPFLFLGAAMLTEPSTMPLRKIYAVAFGVIVGVLSTAQWHIFETLITAEMALVISNVFSFIVNATFQSKMNVQAVEKMSDSIYRLRVLPAKPSRFKAGQYINLTLPKVNFDSRGNRRTFTIASAPENREIQIVFRTYARSSAFKTALIGLKPGSTILGGHLGGDFTLPKNPAKKLLFIAGGIGVTPFMSMAEHLRKTKERRDIILIYQVSDVSDAVGMELFSSAKKYGLSLVLNEDNAWQTQLAKSVPDIADRLTYISGPNGFVRGVKAKLLDADVPRSAIKTDFFSGY